MNNVAYAMLQQGKKESLAMAQQANAAAPGTAAFMDTLALALAADGQFDKAVAVQRSAIEKASGAPGLRVNLARIYIQAGDKTQARKELEAVRALGDKFKGQAEVTRLLDSLG
jgi:Flp pilus assembly protein TadD